MTKNIYRYKDEKNPVSQRVEDLLSLMTIDEKLSQLASSWHYPFFSKETRSEAMERILKNGIGTISWLLPAFEPDENVKVMNTIQKFAMENTRLGIPVLFHGEALAGGLFYGSTYFPTAIGLASSWDPDIITDMCEVIREQMYSYGVRIVFSPVLDIARDPRWGRIGETYGEDPYLASQMGKAYISSIQGGDPKKSIAATGKHFLGYAAGEAGKNGAAAGIGERELYEIYARPFEAVIRDCKVRAIMNSYGIIDNVPMPGSKKLLTDLLKKQLGHEGIVFSDYGTVSQLLIRNRSAQNNEDAAIQAITAGIDVELPEPSMYPSLKDAVKAGRIDIGIIDDSVRKMLKLKFELGLFDDPYAPGDVKKTVDTKRNRGSAYDAAISSMVLLKNEDKILPIDKDIASIAVIGPNADNIRCLFGGYSSVAMREITPGATLIRDDETIIENRKPAGRYGDPADIDGFARYFYKGTLSVLEAIRETASPGTVINYAKGCDIISDSDDGFEEALNAAKNSDLAVLVLGGREGMGPLTTCGEGRDRTDITLMGLQQQLLEKIYKTGVPIVLVLINSRPLAIPWAVDNVPAILQAWTPGESGGKAVADILFGKKVPGGKLPVTMLRNTGQIPMYYNRKPIYSDIDMYACYIDGNNTPLYPFGHGLSYTDFEYSDLQFEDSQVDIKGSVKFSFKISNTGKIAGDEVAQVYFRDREADVTRPVKELTGFIRVTLSHGCDCRIAFTVDIDQLAFYDKDMDLVLEPGNIDVYIGSSSEDIRLRGEFKITGQKLIVAGKRSYSSKAEITEGEGNGS